MIAVVFNEFVKFCFVGLAGYFIELVILTLVLVVVENNYFAKLLSVTSAILFVWLLNTKFTFEQKKTKIKDLISYIFSMLPGASTSVFVFAYFSKLQIFPSIELTLFATTVVVAPLNFICAKFVVQ